MKKAVIISSIVALAYIVLDESGVLNSLVDFLLIGAVPGTSIDLSPNAMFLVGAAIAWTVLVNLTVVKLVNFITAKRTAGEQAIRHSRTPKRRYSRS